MSEGHAQGPYVATRVGFENATLRAQGTELTTEPPCPTNVHNRLHKHTMQPAGTWSPHTSVSLRVPRVDEKGATPFLRRTSSRTASA